jgi:hypothetical protein
VYAGFEIERRLRILLEQLVVTGLAVAFRTLEVRGVIERHVTVFGRKREFFRSFLFLRKQSESSHDRGKQTRDESTHAMNVSFPRQALRAMAEASQQVFERPIKRSRREAALARRLHLV